MKPLKQLKRAIQNSSNLLQNHVSNYIEISPESKQLVLKPKAVLLLCQQAVDRVEQLTSLVPDINEGLIATIEHGQVKVKIKFSPDKVFLNGDAVEGQLRLLNKPEIESDSMIYRTLIAGWKIFLGGNIPSHALPEGVRVDGEMVYYRFPNTKLQILDVLFHSLENGSALNLNLKEGELKVQSDVSINWSEINFQGLLRFLNSIGEKEQSK